jgi:transcriptional regulator with XRE-family HTH domain
MKTKRFHEYLEKRLNKEEITQIEYQAELEVKILKQIQDAITRAVSDYMETHNIGFNELVRRLNASPTHVAKIQRGEANLTLSSLAHLLALLGKEPQEMFKNKTR